MRMRSGQEELVADAVWKYQFLGGDCVAFSRLTTKGVKYQVACGDSAPKEILRGPAEDEWAFGHDGLRLVGDVVDVGGQLVCVAYVLSTDSMRSASPTTGPESYRAIYGTSSEAATTIDINRVEGEVTCEELKSPAGRNELLVRAMRRRSIESVRSLLLHGGDPNTRDPAGRPLLSYAASALSDAVPLFVKAGADVNALDNDGWTPLMYAAEQGDAGTIRRLIVAGADTRIRNAQGGTAEEIARLHGRAEVTDVLGAVKRQ